MCMVFQRHPDVSVSVCMRTMTPARKPAATGCFSAHANVADALGISAHPSLENVPSHHCRLRLLQTTRGLFFDKYMLGVRDSTLAAMTTMAGKGRIDGLLTSRHSWLVLPFRSAHRTDKTTKTVHPLLASCLHAQPLGLHSR